MDVLIIDPDGVSGIFHYRSDIFVLLPDAFRSCLAKSSLYKGKLNKRNCKMKKR